MAIFSRGLLDCDLWFLAKTGKNLDLEIQFCGKILYIYSSHEQTFFNTNIEAVAEQTNSRSGVSAAEIDQASADLIGRVNFLIPSALVEPWISAGEAETDSREQRERVRERERACQASGRR